jgi:hypothetical protein
LEILVLSNTKQPKTPLTLNYSISNQIQTKCSSQSGIIQSDDIAYENIYLNKLDKIFNKFTTNLVDLKWARESHLTLNHSNIDLISKYNQNNPVFVNLINKNIKNTSDYDDIVKYFNSNLTDLSFADLSKLFRVLNIMDNEPFNNDLILNIEKHFYASLEKHSNASAFSIHDFEPITGRVHQPPPVHQTFEAHNYVICSFVPRLYDYHPLAIPAPYNHSNVDSDELLYYVDGEFMSRKNVSKGQLTLHPAGIPHGPHPGTVEKSIGKKETKELAVMIDTFKPLWLTEEGMKIMSDDYYKSWIDA